MGQSSDGSRTLAKTTEKLAGAAKSLEKAMASAAAQPALSYVEVTGNGQQYSASGRTFRFDEAVELTGLSPSRGLTEGGTR